MDPEQGQTPTGTQPQQGQNPQSGRPLENASQDDYIAMIRDLRAEQKQRREENEQLKTQLEQLQPAAAKLAEIEQAQKSEAEKMADRVAKLEAELNAAQTQAKQAAAERRLTVLATKAGVPAEMLQFLDVSKFDLDDEEATTKALASLVPARSASSGGSSNPARQTPNGQPGTQVFGDDEMRAWYTNVGKRNYIFGDK